MTSGNRLQIQLHCRITGKKKKESSLLREGSQCKLQKASKATGINGENQNGSLTLLEGGKNTHSKLDSHSQATSNN